MKGSCQATLLSGDKGDWGRGGGRARVQGLIHATGSGLDGPYSRLHPPQEALHSLQSTRLFSFGIQTVHSALRPMHGRQLAALALPSGHSPPGLRLSQWENRPAWSDLRPRVASRPPGLCFALAGGGALRPLDARPNPGVPHPGLLFCLPFHPPAPRSGYGWAFGQGLRTWRVQGVKVAMRQAAAYPPTRASLPPPHKFLSQVSRALALGRGRVAAVR